MKYSYIDNLAFLLRYNSQRVAAKFIGVNSRTLERWLAGSVPKPDTQEKIASAAKKIRRAVKKLTELGDAPDIINNLYSLKSRKKNFKPDSKSERLFIYGKRRELIVYNARGKPTGEYRDSDWVNYRVNHLDFNLCFDILKQLRDAGNRRQMVQIIFLADPQTESDGHRYAYDGTELAMDEELEVEQFERKGSTIQAIYDLTNPDLKRLLKRYYRPYYPYAGINILYISVIQT